MIMLTRCVGILIGGVIYAVDPAETKSEGFERTFFFYGLLPPIILEAGFSLQKKAFFSNLGTILSLAVVGTLIATFVTGGILSSAGYLTSAECFVYGALISAVDPVATLSVFKKLEAPDLLFNLVFGESVLNDAVAIVLYEIFVEFSEKDEGFTTGTALRSVGMLFGIGIGSIAFAFIVSLSTAYLLKRANEVTNDALKQHPVYEISIVLLTSYLGYLLSGLAHLSPIVSLFFSGTLISHYHMHNISERAQVWKTLLLFERRSAPPLERHSSF
jgi:sodium/hydrogen exchanger 8